VVTVEPSGQAYTVGSLGEKLGKLLKLDQNEALKVCSRRGEEPQPLSGDVVAAAEKLLALVEVGEWTERDVKQLRRALKKGEKQKAKGIEGSPRRRNTCPHCKYVGQHGKYDLYVCEVGFGVVGADHPAYAPLVRVILAGGAGKETMYSKSIIEIGARYAGAEGYEGAWWEAVKRAKELGLVEMTGV
jgi:hypothetical protein